MSDNSIPQEIMVIMPGIKTSESDELEFRHPKTTDVIISQATQAVNVDHLHSQVNVFLQQLDQVLDDTPETVGGFKLTEIEVSAGIVVRGQGEVKLALIASAEVGGEINAGLKFVFRK